MWIPIVLLVMPYVSGLSWQLIYYAFACWLLWLLSLDTYREFCACALILTQFYYREAILKYTYSVTLGYITA